MDIHFENYIIKALHDAKIAELVERYKQQGYIPPKKALAEYRGFDLVLRNATTGKVIVFEVKTLPLSDDARAAVLQVKRKADKLGFEFRLATIAKPTRYSIEIDWFDNAVFDYIVRNPLSDLDIRATHVRYEDVQSDIQSISIIGARASVKATGTIDVELQFGSDADVDNDFGDIDHDSFPYSGEFELDIVKQEVLEAEIIVEDAEWYKE